MHDEPVVSDEPDLRRLAGALGDASRIRMLTLLMEGRALTAKELAYGAGIEPATATAHLRRLVEDGFLQPAVQGRHKYFRLTSPAVARLIESMMALAPSAPTPVTLTPIRAARYCYDHLAGRLGLSLAQALVGQELVRRVDDAFLLTEPGERWCGELGLDVPALRQGRRKFAYPCLDWSERQDHLGGALGAALALRMTELGWIERRRHSRVVTVTADGRQALATRLGIAVPVEAAG